MRLEKIVWYDRHHVLLSFDKFSYALSRFPRSIKIPTLYQDCLCETSEAWKNFKQFKIFSRSPRPSRFTHALLRSSRFDHTTPYDPPAFLKRGERGKRDPSVNLAEVIDRIDRITFISNHDGWITYNKTGYYYAKLPIRSRMKMNKNTYIYLKYY